MWTKVLLLIAATFLLLSVAASNEPQENDVEKRGKTHTLNDVVKMIQQVEKRQNNMSYRLRGIESKRLILLQGRDGRDGMSGKSGKEGKDGAQGPRGTQGPQGPRGRQGSQGLRGGGVVYIRWGKTACPTGADFVYKGRIGGENHLHFGGGANYVCLPETPKYANHKPGHQGGAYMYGAEYQVSNLNNLFSKNYLHDHEAPCVACHVKTRSSKLMIPARNDCPSGWTQEYHGYLMAERHNHKSNKEFICVDKDADLVPGTHANKDGALLYPVEGVCGSLPCRPYVSGWELTCAVCTK